jgi:hypothetical protein
VEWVELEVWEWCRYDDGTWLVLKGATLTAGLERRDLNGGTN